MPFPPPRGLLLSLLPFGLLALGACAADTPSAPSAAPPPVAARPVTEREAWELIRAQDYPNALRAYAAFARQRAAALAETADPAAAQAIADEIELALESVSLLADPFGMVGLAQAELAALQVPEHYGMAWARARGAEPDLAPVLGLLTSWEFIGPFDNERGAAMSTALPAESEPDRTRAWPGKVREVRWRPTPPGVHPEGLVRFQHLVRPWRMSAVLARTWVHSDADLEAVLLLGAGEEARVWVNGEPVLDAFEPHVRRLDALAAPCRLLAGWNEIAVKLGARDDELGLQARLVRAADGSPLRLAHGVGADRPAPRVLAPEPAPLPDPAQRPGVAGRLARATAPDDLRALGLLQSWREMGPRHTFPGRKALDAAFAAAPDDLRIAYARLDLQAPADFEHAEELDLNPWLQAIGAVQRLAPQDPYPAWQEFLLRIQHQGAPEHAAQVVERLRSSTPPSFRAPLAALRLAEYEEDDALVELHARQLLATPGGVQLPLLRLQLAGMLHSTHAPAWRREAEYAAATSRRPQPLRELLDAEREARAEFDLDAEHAALRRLLALDPWHPDPRLDWAEFFLAAGALDAAFACIAEAEQLCPELPRAQALRARARLAADDSEGAIAALERELELDFSADDERRLLEHLQASGARSSFEAEFAEPLTDVVRRHPGPLQPDHPDLGSEVLLWRTVARVHPDGTAQTYFRKVVRILDQKGALAYDTADFPHYAGEEELRVLTAEVHRPDGAVERARTGRGSRAGRVELPPLAPGDVLDLAWRVDDRRPGIFGRYFGFDHALTSDLTVPTGEAEAVILAPADLPLALHARNLPAHAVGPLERTRPDGLRELRWSVAGLAPARLEAFMPQIEERAPTVQASTWENWEEFGAWWWDLIAPGIVSSPEIRAKVAELTAGRPDRLAQVRAIYEFVANDVRYNAWEFGVHGYQPYSAPVIFSRKFGDCKDKAILLRAMLAEIGVEAYPVLIKRAATSEWQGRRPAEDHALALVSHFNHCIAWLPEQPGVPETWLDGTARLHPLEVLPYDDRGAAVLIVRPDGVAHVRIPDANAADELDARRFVFELRPDGGGRAGVEFAPRGRHDARFRETFAGGGAEARERAERLATSMLGPFDGAADIELPPVERLDAPQIYRLRADVRALARVVDGGLELPATVQALDLMRGTALESTRTTDVLLDGATRREQVIEVRLPADWIARDLPPPVELDVGDAAFAWRVETTPEGLRIVESFELRTPRIAASRYAAFRDFCRAVDEAQRQDLRLEAARP